MNVTLWKELDDQQAEKASGGERAWPSLGGQILPPGLYNGLITEGKIPQGLLGGDTPEYGNKVGFVVGPLGVVPPGWQS